jgi:ribonuclease G
MNVATEEKVIVNVTPRETRVAWIENGVLQEVWVERVSKRGLVGNLYRGRVVRVLPGMQAAFVDVGLDKATFLHVSDVCIKPLIFADQTPVDLEDITRLLREGQEILVQVIKDPLGSKGARVSMNITLPSHLLVHLPREQTTGVSQRIESQEERERLRSIVEGSSERGQMSGGFIVRTVAEGVQAQELLDNMRFLHKLWQHIEAKMSVAKGPTLIHEDLPLFLRVIRDVPQERIESLRVDSRETFLRMQQFAQTYVPELTERIELYQGERPIFDLYSVEDEIQKALERKVPLKSGGYLIIDQTEAMTTIDVNTGAFVGNRNLEETIYKTNLEAAQAIARQLRLRNLGGIIIIDFIDMAVEPHRQQVLQALDRALAKDRTRSTASQLTSLGLVEMTRKRTRESLVRTLCEPCPVCHGRGVVKSIETLVYEVFREVTRMARQYDADKLLVIASEVLVERMLEDESSSIAELESFLNKSISFQVDNHYFQEQFDVVML